MHRPVCFNSLCLLTQDPSCAKCFLAPWLVAPRLGLHAKVRRGNRSRGHREASGSAPARLSFAALSLSLSSEDHFSEFLCLGAEANRARRHLLGSLLSQALQRFSSHGMPPGPASQGMSTRQTCCQSSLPVKAATEAGLPVLGTWLSSDGLASRDQGRQVSVVESCFLGS